ncbi:Cyanidin 3-O-glucoside 7-O-glucosyltransferase (acyl-glucose), partial [Frankliniella fusca]
TTVVVYKYLRGYLLKAVSASTPSSVRGPRRTPTFKVSHSPSEWETRVAVMVRLCVVVVALATLACGSPAPNDQNETYYSLPDELLIGAGTSAMQSEGAWDEDGKAESTVDYVFHTGKLETQGFQDAHTHDRGADSYHRYKDDVAMAAKLGLQVYRFSISWSRVLPEADATRPNKKGVQFYHDLIDEVRAHNITPLVTLYHFDHPQILEAEFKGWLNRKMVDKFREYATFIFAEYGHKVKLWTSMNEPNVYCSYWPKLEVDVGFLQPEDTQNIYPCLHNFVLGHGEARKALTQSGHDGLLGFTVTTLNSRPNSTRPEDAYASEAFNQFYTGMLLHPLVFGDYPPLVKEIAKDILPVFSDEEKAMLKNSTDYIGLNVYYGLVVSYRSPNSPRIPVIMPMTQLLEQLDFVNVGYRDPQGGTLADYPLNTYKKPIMITENGYGDIDNHGTEDNARAVYHSAFMRSMISAVRDFGVRVIGYCAWSLVDSFEWSAGYDRPFGLVHVDIKGGSYNRTLKASASFWQELAERRIVPLVEMPMPSSASAPATASALVALLLTTAVRALSC